MKKIIILLTIFILCGCSKDKKDYINTIIENNDETLIGISYPNTNIKILDEEINKYIKNSYEEFKNNYNDSELNIDYTYNTVDNYYSVSLKKFIDSNTLAHPINEIKTFVYDKNSNSLISFKDLVKDNFNSILPIIKKEINKYKNCIVIDDLDNFFKNMDNYDTFTVDNEYLTIYFNPYIISSGDCNIISINIPIKQLNIKTEIVIKETPVIELDNRVIDVNSKIIALTFDDGPSKYTSKIIEYLKEEDAVATFFMLGNKVDIYDETVKKVLEYGNEIGNHSYSHKLLSTLDGENLKNQIDKTQHIIYDTTGFMPTLLRPTYGSVNKKLKNNTDLDIVLWDIDTLDWKLKNSKSIASKVINKVRDKDIILMHDTYERTYNALKIIVPELKKQGFKFVTVSELNEIKLLQSYQE